MCQRTLARDLALGAFVRKLLRTFIARLLNFMRHVIFRCWAQLIHISPLYDTCRENVNTSLGLAAGRKYTCTHIHNIHAPARRVVNFTGIEACEIGSPQPRSSGRRNLADWRLNAQSKDELSLVAHNAMITGHQRIFRIERCVHHFHSIHLVRWKYLCNAEKYKKSIPRVL